MSRLNANDVITMAEIGPSRYPTDEVESAVHVAVREIAALRAEVERLKSEADKYAACPTCGGDGLMEVLVAVHPPDGREESAAETCAECGGNGIALVPRLEAEIKRLTEELSAAIELGNNTRETLTTVRYENARLKADLSVPGRTHCKDCCCAQSWKALGVTEYDGKSIPEHIERLKTQLAEVHDDICENGHTNHADCTEACACVGSGKSALERAEGEAMRLAEEVGRLKATLASTTGSMLGAWANEDTANANTKKAEAWDWLKAWLRSIPDTFGSWPDSVLAKMAELEVEDG